MELQLNHLPADVSSVRKSSQLEEAKHETGGKVKTTKKMGQAVASSSRYVGPTLLLAACISWHAAAELALHRRECTEWGLCDQESKLLRFLANHGEQCAASPVLDNVSLREAAAGARRHAPQGNLPAACVGWVGRAAVECQHK